MDSLQELYVALAKIPECLDSAQIVVGCRGAPQSSQHHWSSTDLKQDLNINTTAMASAHGPNLSTVRAEAVKREAEAIRYAPSVRS